MTVFPFCCKKQKNHEIYLSLFLTNVLLDFLWSISREGLHQLNDHRFPGFDPGGITIYNMTSKKGDVSSEKG